MKLINTYITQIINSSDSVGVYRYTESITRAHQEGCNIDRNYINSKWCWRHCRTSLLNPMVLIARASRGKRLHLRNKKFHRRWWSSLSCYRSVACHCSCSSQGIRLKRSLRLPLTVNNHVVKAQISTMNFFTLKPITLTSMGLLIMTWHSSDESGIDDDVMKAEATKGAALAGSLSNLIHSFGTFLLGWMWILVPFQLQKQNIDTHRNLINCSTRTFVTWCWECLYSAHEC